MATVVVQQPSGKAGMEAWNSGICDCFQDLKSCCYAYWCFPCFSCSTTGEFGESTCLPLLDILGPALMAALGIGVCVPPVALGMRVAVRYKYHIGGSLCEDIMVSCCCVWCSWCQMSREIKARKKAIRMIQPVPMVINPQVVAMQQPGVIGCYGFWCFPCFMCTTTGEFGESTCLPLLDIFGPAILAAFGIQVCVPPVSLGMRVAVRHKYDIGFGESTCLPLVDMFGPGILAAFGLPICAPPVSLGMRVAVRYKYNIRGSICRDIMVSCLCVWCSWCQMSREIKARKQSVTVMTTQPVIQTIPMATATHVITTQ
ncbi:hypothetical protein Q8A67_023771 [Cirrhinus molitorella]|uniref:Uncharacterized protein n=1 Tax=Cirrhinus molitorella TaxID=172907 RepID=A0AA88P2P9_9TELE|nr:hypothetical protein Q8A67_023771 [Cirrhinus molitorella]